MTDPSMDSLVEEEWEQDIAAALGRLPAVAMPEGTIETALNHRPLYAGRTFAVLSALAVAAFAMATMLGAGRSTLVPDVDGLAKQHTAVEAGVVPGLGDYRAVEYTESPVAMPTGFEPRASFAVDDLRQAVYGRGDESVSVFVQPGELNWDELVGGNRTVIAENLAWVDSERDVVVVQAADQVVTIVGLSPEETGDVLESIGPAEPSFWERARALAGGLSKQLGYPEPTG